MASSSSSSRMIVVPYKRPFDLDISYNIKSFLDNTYAGNPNLQEFKQSVDSLNLLRNEALFRAARQEKLAKLMRYVFAFLFVKYKFSYFLILDIMISYKLLRLKYQYRKIR